MRHRYLHSPHCELSLSPHGEYLRDTPSICLPTKMDPASNPALPTHTSSLAAHLRLEGSLLLIFMFVCLNLYTLCISQKENVHPG